MRLDYLVTIRLVATTEEEQVRYAEVYRDLRKRIEESMASGHKLELPSDTKVIWRLDMGVKPEVVK